MNVARAPFELGVTRLFGNGDIGAEGLIRGWAEPEDAHLWNEGVEAIMELTVQKAEHGYELEIEGEPFINSACPIQEITLYCNGFRTGFWNLDEPKSYMLVATIEPEQMFIRSGYALARLVWLLPKSTKPTDIKLNNDNRRLGFCFRTLTIRDADHGSMAAADA